jgi:hypothetical protein
VLKGDHMVLLEIRDVCITNDGFVNKMVTKEGIKESIAPVKGILQDKKERDTRCD